MVVLEENTVQIDTRVDTGKDRVEDTSGTVLGIQGQPRAVLFHPPGLKIVPLMADPAGIDTGQVDAPGRNLAAQVRTIMFRAALAMLV